MAKTHSSDKPADHPADEAAHTAPDSAHADAALRARVAELEAELAATKAAASENPFLVPVDITKRPDAGPLHKDGHPIFNVARPTGRQG